MMNRNFWSNHILTLKNWAKNNGATVKMFCNDLPDNIAGQCDYKQKEIKIRNWQNAELAFLSLLHECGHWYSFLRNSHRDLNKEHREWLAFFCGFRLAKELQIKINRETWKNFHKN